MTAYSPGEQPSEPGLIKLNTNENPYPPSPQVLEALAGVGTERLRLYPPPDAGPLRTKAAEVYGVNPEQVLVGNGSDDLLAICMRACVSDGGSVAYAVPTYFLYSTLAKIAGADVVEVPASAQDEGVPQGLIDARAAVTFVCSPNSPCGSAVAVDRIGELASAARGLVVADEAYVDFSNATALDILARHPNLVVLRSMSKSFSLAGMRLGLAFASASLVKELYKVKDSYNVSSIATVAGVAALTDMAWMKANVAKVVATRERCLTTLRDAGYAVADSQANFFWLEHPTRPGASVYDHLRSRGILVRYFDTPALRAGVRITIGTDSEMAVLIDALVRIAPD